MTTDMEKQEVLFENAFLMTQERYLWLCSHPKVKSAIKKQRIWKTLQSVCLLVGICIAIMGIIQKEYFFTLIDMVFVLVFLYKRIFQLRNRNIKLYATIRKTQASEEWNRITHFFESGIEIEDANMVTKLDYHQISHLSDDGEECILWLKNDTIVRLMHSEFTVGSYENFATFINQKLAENTVNTGNTGNTEE